MKEVKDIGPVPLNTYRRGVNARQGVKLFTPPNQSTIPPNTPWCDLDPTPEIQLSYQRCWTSHTLTLYPGEYAVYCDVTYNVGIPGVDLHFDRTGELGERPWQESEMTSDEIKGGKGLDYEDKVRAPKNVWFQLSSRDTFNVEESDRNTKDFNGTIHNEEIPEECWAFMAESQGEAATRALVTRLGEMHNEILSAKPLIDAAKPYCKKEKGSVKDAAERPGSKGSSSRPSSRSGVGGGERPSSKGDNRPGSRGGTGTTNTSTGAVASTVTE
jgi:hypothetical protein